MNQQDLTPEQRAPEQMTPEQARAALESTPTLGNTARDRRIHGLATAAFGALIGGYVGLYQGLPDDHGARSGMTGVYIFLLFALAAWQAKNIKSWPRHSKITSYLGLAGTVVLAGIGTLGLNVLETRTGVRADISPVWYVAAALGIAAPMLTAGRLIAKRKV